MANYLIIGGTSHIGFSTAEKLLSTGHAVFMTDRDAAKTKQIATMKI